MLNICFRIKIQFGFTLYRLRKLYFLLKMKVHSLGLFLRKYGKIYMTSYHIMPTLRTYLINLIKIYWRIVVYWNSKIYLLIFLQLINCQNETYSTFSVSVITRPPRTDKETDRHVCLSNFLYSSIEFQCKFVYKFGTATSSCNDDALHPLICQLH